MITRTWLLVPLLVACGGARFDGTDISTETTDRTADESTDMFVDGTDTDVTTDSTTDTDESDTDGFEGADEVFELSWEDFGEVWTPEADAADAELRQGYAERAGCSAPPSLGESFEPARFTGVSFSLDYPYGETSIDLWVDDVAFLGGGVAGIEGEPCPS